MARGRRERGERTWGAGEDECEASVSLMCIKILYNEIERV